MKSSAFCVAATFGVGDGLGVDVDVDVGMGVFVAVASGGTSVTVAVGVLPPPDRPQASPVKTNNRNTNKDSENLIGFIYVLHTLNLEETNEPWVSPIYLGAFYHVDLQGEM